MFELYSVLRYYPIGAPEDIHYTATITEGGVWQVKGAGSRTMFPTVEEWLQSLPGSPDPSMLSVSTKLAEQHRRKEEQKIEKVKTGKKKWNITARNIPMCLRWARHIYTMIRECDKALLKREDMRDAFNHLVQILLDHNTIIQTTAPYRRRRYTHGITVTNNNMYSNIRDYVHAGPQMKTHDQYLDTVSTIYEAYQPLYELLKDTVVPFMEKKYKEMCNKRDLKIYQRKLDKSIQQMMKLNDRYEKESSYLRDIMARYQSFITQLEQ